IACEVRLTLHSALSSDSGYGRPVRDGDGILDPVRSDSVMVTAFRESQYLGTLSADSQRVRNRVIVRGRDAHIRAVLRRKRGADTGSAKDLANLSAVPCG